MTRWRKCRWWTTAVRLLMDVAGVEYDSRRVRRGDVFVAMRGGTTDGNRFIDAAIAQGAAAMVTDSREAYERLRDGACRSGVLRWWSMGGGRWRS